MLKRNSINAHSNTVTQLALQIWRLSKVRTAWPYIYSTGLYWVILAIFDRFRLKPTIDRPEQL